MIVTKEDKRSNANRNRSSNKSSNNGSNGSYDSPSDSPIIVGLEMIVVIIVVTNVQ